MKKTLVLGYGNSIRSDDGAGIAVAERIYEMKLPDVEVRCTQQLHVELIEDFSSYERVILVDASHEGPGVDIQKVTASEKEGISSSHHLGPEMIAGLAGRLFNKELNLYVCSVRGSHFDFGSRLTNAAAGRVKEAANEIRKMIAGETGHA